MKNALFKIALVIVPVVLLLLYVEVKLAGVPNTYNTKKNQLELVKNETELLILGNSQTMFGINPEFLPLKAYNLANTNQDYYRDSALLAYYLPQMPKLKTILLPISDFSLGCPLHNTEPWREFFYYHYWKIEPEFNRSDIRKHSMIALYTPRTAFYHLRNFFNISMREKIHSNGFQEIYFSESQLTAPKVKTNLLRLQNINDAKYFDISFRRLKSIITMAQKNNIQVILIKTPANELFRRYQDKQIHRKSEAYFAQLYQQTGLTFLDYSVCDELVDEDFLDAYHLNGFGAKKFSRILGKRLGDMKD
jgi:hypothetical protein